MEVRFLVVNQEQDVRIYPAEREMKRSMIRSLKYLECSFGLSLNDSAIVVGHDVFQSLKEYMS